MAKNIVPTRAYKEKKRENPRVYDIIRESIDPDNPPKGNKYGICKICHKQFEQQLWHERNMYSNFPTCPACRNRNKKDKEKSKTIKEELSTLALLPFNPFPWQKKAAEDFEKYQFQVIAAANRAGKDRYSIMMGIRYFAQCLDENRQIDHPELVPSVYWWQIAPTEKIAKQNWRELKQYMPKGWIVSVSDASFTMNTIGGGVIEVRSAYSPQDLVGVGLDLATITEAPRIRDLDVVVSNLQARLISPGRGREKDRKGKIAGAGKMILNGSPVGKGYFYQLFKKGQKGTDEYSSNWISYQLTWRENPYLNEKADELIDTRFGKITLEEDLRRQMGDRLFRQNYLADFLAMDGTVFKDFEEKCVQNVFNMGIGKEEIQKYIKEWSMPIPANSYRIGYDPATGSSVDSPAIVVRDMVSNRIVHIQDLYGKNYDQQWDEIAYVSRMYNYAPCVWLRTGHTAVENQLAKRGVVEIPIDEMGGRKAEYIQSLERAIQNNDFHVLLDGGEMSQRLVLQMSDYTETNGKYSNDQQEHDDFVSACYAAWYDYSVETEKRFYFGRMGFIKRE